MGASVDASEWHALGAEISAHPATVPAKTYRAGRDVGADLGRTVDLLTPKRTGYLASRNNVRVTPLGAGVEVELTNDARYAEYVEDGTSDTPAQPFAGPGFDRHSGDFGPALLDVSLDL